MPTTSQLLRQAAHEYRDSDKFQPMSKLFFDGAEYLLPNIAKDLASVHNAGFRNEIHSKVEGMSVRNLLLSQRRGYCYMWLTPTPETAFTDECTMQRFIEIEEAIKSYINRILMIQGDEPAVAHTTKFDFARDVGGSFSPAADGKVRSIMKCKL